MAEEQVPVEKDNKVTWAPVRQLAEDISKLYADKRIFDLKDESALEGSDTTLSVRSTRSTDPNANICTISSADKGCVYLSKDITAPFRVDKLGQSGVDTKVLAFEFAYHPDKYEEYLNGSAKPVLTTQYLVYHETIENEPTSNPDGLVYTADCIARELHNENEEADYDDFNTIANLIESDRSKLRRFWNYGNNTDGADYYSTDTEIAGELYMLLDYPTDAQDPCCYIARVAFAGLNNNGNGNSICATSGARPAPWVDGHVGADICYFVKESPWMSDGRAVTLTGISMDRNPESNLQTITNTEKGFRPETPGASEKTYAPPPIGCSSQFIWPTIGVEGGGDRNSFYSPSIFSTYIDWSDWREDFRKPLLENEVAYAKVITTNIKEIPDDKHFPCYLGEKRTGDLSSTYNYIGTRKSITATYQRWVQVDSTTFVRMVPMEFNVPSDTAHKVYLTVPLTVAKVLKPRSYQTAIRKRWYDMMYYTLRNIAGYKYKKYIDGIGDCYRVIGVTWNRMKVNDTLYLNPCMSTPNKEDCLCTECSYERWKILDLGGEGHDDETNPDITPFVGAKSEFTARNAVGNNAAQLWTWKPERFSQVAAYLNTDATDYDVLFPELYFERLLCYNNETLYSSKEGGFANPKKENKLCECLICYYTSYQESPINLPWNGGGKNTTCKSEESDVTSYNTHAYTFKVLKDLTKFITDYKLPEDKPRAINYLEIGYCYCPATMGDTMGITLKDRTVTHYNCTARSDDDEICISETTDLKLPEIPSYYNTLAENEKALLEPTGIECVLDIAKDLKPFGYNAYVWKAVDIGGYSENRKDIKIEFVHYNPARVCSSGTIMDRTLLTEFPVGKDDDPLYMYDTNCYTAAEETTVTRETHPCNPEPPAEICPNAEGSIRSFNYNRQDKATWDEVLYWSNKKRSTCKDGAPDPASMASAKIWHRDNEFTSIGTIEIYVAPFFTPGGDSDHGNMAKFLGKCNIQRVLNQETPFTATTAIPYQVTDYACATIIPVSEEMDSAVQEVKINEDNSFTSNATKLITFKVTRQPTDNRDKPDENYVKIDIIIPSELLIDENPEGETDLRQKYIILATRASHTNINSGLAGKSGQVTDETPENIKKWATTYAGACRYDEFKTSYKFSVNSEQ